MATLRVAFMGSPAFALPTLNGLLEAGHDAVLVVSQPDRRAGRSRHLRASAVAAFATDRGLHLYQPERLRSQAEIEPLVSAQPDVIVVAAFGLLLPSTVLELPPHGCLNV